MSATPFMQGDNIALLTPPTVAHSGSWEESLQVGAPKRGAAP